MSNYWQAVVEYNSKAVGVTRTVVMLLASNAGEDGRAWPSVANLARRARCSERSVQYALRRLCEAGELELLAHGGGDGRGKGHASLYQLRVQDLHRQAFEGANHNSLRVQPVAPQPSVIEPSSNGAIAPTISPLSVSAENNGADASADNSALLVPADVARTVWDYWRKKIQPDGHCTDLALETIKRRLGRFEPRDLCLAVAHFAADPWEMENNAWRPASWFFDSPKRLEAYVAMDPAERQARYKAQNARRNFDDEGEQVRDYEVTDYVEQERQRLFGKGGD